MSPPDRLIAAELSASLGESVIGRRIIVLESTRSTNDFLLQMLTPELPEGFVVFAEHQSRRPRPARASLGIGALTRGFGFQSCFGRVFRPLNRLA